MDLASTTALVAGGAEGIGTGIAERLAAARAKRDAGAPDAALGLLVNNAGGVEQPCFPRGGPGGMGGHA
jgi:NAD(P)-dependent dehydrogenase (short-subunit alcohol dehydrogenase family)